VDRVCFAVSEGHKDAREAVAAAQRMAQTLQQVRVALARLGGGEQGEFEGEGGAAGGGADEVEEGGGGRSSVPAPSVSPGPPRELADPSLWRTSLPIMSVGSSATQSTIVLISNDFDFK